MLRVTTKVRRKFLIEFHWIFHGSINFISVIACNECKQVFVRGTGEFTRHLRETTCRPYACDFCNKLFKKKSNMKTHRLTHLNATAVCDECGASFKCHQYLKNHQKRVHHVAFVKEEELQNGNDQQSSGEPKAKRMKIDSTSHSTSNPPPMAVIPSGLFEEFVARQMANSTNFSN